MLLHHYLLTVLCIIVIDDLFNIPMVLFISVEISGMPVLFQVIIGKREMESFSNCRDH